MNARWPNGEHLETRPKERVRWRRLSQASARGQAVDDVGARWSPATRRGELGAVMSSSFPRNRSKRTQGDDGTEKCGIQGVARHFRSTRGTMAVESCLHLGVAFVHQRWELSSRRCNRLVSDQLRVGSVEIQYQGAPTCMSSWQYGAISPTPWTSSPSTANRHGK